VRRFTRYARIVLVVAGVAGMLLSSATVAIAKPDKQTDATTTPLATTTTPFAPLGPDGFCAYWGPLYAFVFPDGTVVRCG
jgi:hypothetical protein